MAEHEVRKFWLFEKIALIALAIIIDVAQIILDFFLIGAIVNRIIDIAFVVILFLWLLLTGRMNSQIIKLTIGTFIGEEIPIVDLLPLWSAEVIYLIHLVDSGKVKTHSAGELVRGGWVELGTETAGSMSTVPGGQNVPGVAAVEQGLEKKAEGAIATAKNKAENLATGIGSETADLAKKAEPQNWREKAANRIRAFQQRNAAGGEPSEYENPAEAEGLLTENERLAQARADNPGVSEAIMRKMADDKRRSGEATDRLGAYAQRDSMRSLRDSVGGAYQRRTPEERAARERRRRQVARGRTVQEVRRMLGSDTDIS